MNSAFLQMVVANDSRRIVVLMVSNFYGCFGHDTCGSKDCSKTAKFSAKTTSLGDRSEDPELLKKVISFDVSWMYGNTHT